MCWIVPGSVLVTTPSPKFQKLLVMVPVEVSVKDTLKGHVPLVGLPVKFATGTAAPVPVTRLVLLPPLPVVIATVLVKLPALVGVKRTTRLVAPKAGKLNGVPERIVNGPALTVALPLVSAVPPRLVMTKFACAFELTAIVPKFRLAGETDSCGAVSALPVTALVLLPPLLVKTARLLKLPEFSGLK